MRLRFQFSLRMLFIVVTLLAIPCWYVGTQAQVVAHRKALLEELKKRSGTYADRPDNATERPADVPWVRHRFGDAPVWTIRIPLSYSNSEVAEIEACFPEARLDPPPLVNAIYNQLTSRGDQRAKSAQLELEYWHKDQWRHFQNPPVPTPVQTKDGKTAEVIFLTAPAMSMPGNDFSMAFLLLDKRVVDWASCWTYNRTANQELLLEDVDGDGNLDVAFRAKDGWWGLQDKRQHNRPNDERKWLYAHAITAIGFQSLFPETDRELKVKLSYDTTDQPVVLQAKGLPESLVERQMVECELSVTNKSENELAIDPEKWFTVEMNGAGYHMMYGPADERTILKPGESMSRMIRFSVDGPKEEGSEKEVAILWKFLPSQSATIAPK